MSESTHPLYKIFFTLFACVILVYGLFNTRFLIRGPEIVLAKIAHDAEVITSDSPSFTLTGQAIHSSFFTINDKPVVVDEQGHFTEKFLLFDEVNSVNLLARDKFGKEIHKKLKIVYTGEPDSLAVESTIFETPVEESTESEETSEETPASPEPVSPTPEEADTSQESSSEEHVPVETSSEF